MTWMLGLVLISSLDLSGGETTTVCSSDTVAVGSVCVDKYEASVWQVPQPTTSNKGLVAKLRKGTATLEDLRSAGATQLGCESSPFNLAPFPERFPRNGNWVSVVKLVEGVGTPGVYAASIPGVLPSTCISWFQAAQACLLSDKRLPTNAEWQSAASGTQDPGASFDNESTTCNIWGPPFEPTFTGSRSACRSNWNAIDMVGNAEEWVADWVPASSGECPGWGGFSDDSMCLTGVNEAVLAPYALTRGGNWFYGVESGVFAVDGAVAWSMSTGLGFRCVR